MSPEMSPPDDAPLGSFFWDWDLVTGEVIYSSAVGNLLGLPAGALGKDAPWWIAQVVPEDRWRVRMRIGRAIRRGRRWTRA